MLAKCELASEIAKTNLRSFATYANGHLGKNKFATSNTYMYFISTICHFFVFQNAKENYHTFATFAKGFLGLARAKPLSYKSYSLFENLRYLNHPFLWTFRGMLLNHFSIARNSTIDYYLNKVVREDPRFAVDSTGPPSAWVLVYIGDDIARL